MYEARAARVATAIASPTDALEVEVSGRYRVRVPAQFEATALKRLLDHRGTMIPQDVRIFVCAERQDLRKSFAGTPRQDIAIVGDSYRRREAERDKRDADEANDIQIYVST